MERERFFKTFKTDMASLHEWLPDDHLAYFVSAFGDRVGV
jgi:hypothetical protein